jgi:hypothetical protein
MWLSTTLMLQLPETVKTTYIKQYTCSSVPHLSLMWLTPTLTLLLHDTVKHIHIKLYNMQALRLTCRACG